MVQKNGLSESSAAEHPTVGQSHLHEQEIPTGKLGHFESSAEALAFENELQRLSPKDDTQRSLQSRAIQAFTEGAQPGCSCLHRRAAQFRFHF